MTTDLQTFDLLLRIRKAGGTVVKLPTSGGECPGFIVTLTVTQQGMGYRFSSELDKVKMVSKRSDTPTSFTPLLVQVGSLTATPPHGH